MVTVCQRAASSLEDWSWLAGLIVSHVGGVPLNCVACQGCMQKKGKDLSACRRGFGLIAQITVFGLALVALLAGAAFWFYVVSV